MLTFTLQEYEIELNFTFIRAGKVCSGKPTNAEASGLSSLGREELIFFTSCFFIVCGSVQSERCVLPLGIGQVELPFGQMNLVLQVDSSTLGY